MQQMWLPITQSSHRSKCLGPVNGYFDLSNCQICLVPLASSSGSMLSVIKLKNIADEDSDRIFIAGAGETVLIYISR